jgi:cytochrome c553
MRLLPVLLLVAMMGLSSDNPTAPLGTYTPAERRHWAFQPRQDAQPPTFTDAAAKAWIRTPVDAFILDGLRKAGLKPAPETDRATLIRRVTYDLHGLPPTPDEVAAFVADKSPKAYESLLDRLLDSPKYGEQWARHWLDVVRFAESDGYEYDTHRPDAWRFRDYVVSSFQTDKPYDEFIKEQLAGDEMEPRSETRLIASGFNRLGPLRKNAGNQDVASSRTEVLTEMANIVSASMLGVTVGCARCHDHKFDPFRQSDYYRLQAYFAQTQSNDVIIATPEEQEKYKATMKPIEAEMFKLRRSMRRASEEEKGKIQTQLEELDEKMPPPLTAFYAVDNKPKEMTQIHLLGRGDYRNKGAKVGMRPLGILLKEGEPELPLETEKPRTKLAEWIAEPSNPLTARVMVNRIWGYHFGRGIVSTPNDFGRMGTRPTHPELLDFLANQYVAGGWKMKPLHRMILMSSAYRQSVNSPTSALAMTKDAGNKLYWKWSRRRLEAEEIRDSILAVSGKLNPKAGGPSVMATIDPELIKDLKRPQYWVAHRDKLEHDRRTLYMIYKRNLILPFMSVFDSPDTLLSCARRDQSTHAPQALELMNGELSNNMARALAARLAAERKTAAEQVDYAWRLSAGRAPNAKERALSMAYLDDPDPTAATEFALSMFNSNAFLYVD